jgi:hypothetical protein
MKTSELTGKALNWAVAKCEGVSVRWSAAHEQLLVEGYPYMVWQPSTNWAQGGPIIEREGIELTCTDEWKAFMPFQSIPRDEDGPTPLIAAMRCYVASKLGEDVSIPEELT